METSRNSPEEAIGPSRQHSIRKTTRRSLFIVDENRIGHLADRNGSQGGEGFGVDDHDVIRKSIGHIELFAVSREPQAPRALAYQYVVQDLPARDVDYRDMIGTSERDIGAGTISRHHDINRRHLLLAQAFREKRHRRDEFKGGEIDYIDDTGELGRNP